VEEARLQSAPILVAGWKRCQDPAFVVAVVAVAAEDLVPLGENSFGNGDDGLLVVATKMRPRLSDFLESAGGVVESGDENAILGQLARWRTGFEMVGIQRPGGAAKAVKTRYLFYECWRISCWASWTSEKALAPCGSPARVHLPVAQALG